MLKILRLGCVIVSVVVVFPAFAEERLTESQTLDVEKHLVPPSDTILNGSHEVKVPKETDAHDSKHENQASIETIKVTDAISVITNPKAGNIGVFVGNDGIFMIDDQLESVSKEVEAAVKAISTKPIRFLLNTHFHFDHTDGNAYFGQQGINIISHTNVRHRLSKDQEIPTFNKTMKASTGAALPVMTFCHSSSLHLNGDTLHMRHYPNAHTDGDVMVYFSKSNVVHMGDLYFAGMYPFIDVHNGGSVDGVISALKHIVGNIDNHTKIIPGHGSVSSKQDLEAMLAMLIAVRDNVKTLVDAGKTRKEVKAAKPSKDYDEIYGQGFLKADQFVELIYDSITQDKRMASCKYKHKKKTARVLPVAKPQRQHASGPVDWFRFKTLSEAGEWFIDRLSQRQE